MSAEQGNPTVSFLGPRASYTHQATLSVFPESSHTIQPKTTIEEVFASVQTGNSTHGVVPFENSSNGSVVFTLDLFADIHAKHPDIIVTGETYLPVHHCLVGYAPPPSPSHLLPPPDTESRISSGQITPTQSHPSPSKPLTKPTSPLHQIKKLYSHPQAWGQCKTFLSTYLKTAEKQDVSSTSRAAELISTSSSHHNDTTTKYEEAAISSAIAAEINGLDILAQGIEDVKGNATRFFILSNNNSRSTNVGRGTGDEGEEEEKGRWKTLVSFTVQHTSPGALADCLAVFKKHGLNLTSINTRPSGVVAWNYIFFVEFVGRRRGEGGQVNEALEELGRVARGWRWLGSFENALLQDGRE